MWNKKDIILSWFKSPVFIGAVAAAAALIILLCVFLPGGKDKDGDVSGQSGSVSSEQTETAGLQTAENGESDVSSADIAAEAGQAQSAEAQPEQTAEGTAEVTQAPEEAVPGISPVAPEFEDGTGAAGIIPLPEAMPAGWHSDDYGSWYCPADGLCYYSGWKDIDGCTYHFGSNLRADKGWTLIGGTGYYFDGSGVYDPNADRNKLVAFTFDDGPSQGTDQLLELCEQTGARVTFFMIGAQVEAGGAVIPHIMRDRCELGNHSYSHSYMLEKTTEECAADFARCDEFIRAFSGGAESTVVRFPYGDYYSEQTAAVGKPNIFWDIDSLDWDSPDKDTIINNVLPKISEGDIILMHCRFDKTVEACREMFPQLIAQGYQLVTVSELAAAKGIQMQGGYTYFGFCNEYIEAGTAYAQ